MQTFYKKWLPKDAEPRGFRCGPLCTLWSKISPHGQLEPKQIWDSSQIKTAKIYQTTTGPSTCPDHAMSFFNAATFLRSSLGSSMGVSAMNAAWDNREIGRASCRERVKIAGVE